MADYVVYILQSIKDSSYYIGWTADLEDRIERHNAGRTKYTKSKMPWKLVYQQKISTKSLAIRREKEIKRYKSHKYLEKLINAYRGVEQPGSSSGS